MRLIIHDLPEDAFETACKSAGCETRVIAAGGRCAPCRGCFACWLKTPGRCFIPDGLKEMGALIGKSDELVIISKNCYGGYSEPVKRAVDRGISSSLPFFTYRNGKLRHVARYAQEKRRLTVILYGGFSDLEKETAEKIVENNRGNLGFKEKELLFVEDVRDIPEMGL